MKTVHTIQAHWEFAQIGGWPEYTTIYAGDEDNSYDNPFPLRLNGDFRPPEGHHLEIRVVVVPDEKEK